MSSPWVRLQLRIPWVFCSLHWVTFSTCPSLGSDTIPSWHAPREGIQWVFCSLHWVTSSTCPSLGSDTIPSWHAPREGLVVPSSSGSLVVSSEFFCSVVWALVLLLLQHCVPVVVPISPACDAAGTNFKVSELPVSMWIWWAGYLLIFPSCTRQLMDLDIYVILVTVANKMFWLPTVEGCLPWLWHHPWEGQLCAAWVLSCVIVNTSLNLPEWLYFSEVQCSSQCWAKTSN